MKKQEFKIKEIKNTFTNGEQKTEIIYVPDEMTDDIIVRGTDVYGKTDRDNYPRVIYKDDNHFIGTRQSGKTTWLIKKLVNDWQILVVVKDKSIKKNMIERAKLVADEKIKNSPYSEIEFSYRDFGNQIMTYEEYWGIQYTTNYLSRELFKMRSYKVYIDELNIFIMNHHIDLRTIAGYTLTIDEREGV